ncbi:MAG: hypothetical protein PUF13_04265 [Lachnospiraceae bacterium]|nr:hypothetical protein [Lachnospiraceae bacterium]
METVPSDEGRQRQAALLAFSAFPELKHVLKDRFEGARFMEVDPAHWLPDLPDR